MKYRVLLAFLWCTVPLFAQMTPSYRMTKTYSARELEEWLKKNVRPRYISPYVFTLTGQISTGWKTIHDKLGTQSQVGYRANSPKNKYNVDAILDYQYTIGQAWVAARTSFRNAGGLFRGTANSFKLDRAFIGYHLTTYGPFVADVLLGRQAFNKLYNSQMQFDGRIDGASLIMSYAWEKWMEALFTGGIYISQSHAYWLTRGNIGNIANLGFYFDYVYTHWGKILPLTATNGIDFKFNTSQFLLGWDYKPSFFKKDLKIFAALIQNHGARPNFLVGRRRQSLAGYTGAQIGSAKKKGDYSLQGMLQFCQVQAIPNWDMSGIGNGVDPVPLYKATTDSTINGNTNFYGWELTLLYSISDNLTATTKLQRSVTLNHKYGRPSNYTTFKLETQYTF